MAAPVDHSHCKVCGRVCEADAETCSKACAKERKRRVEVRRNYAYIMYALIAFIVLLFVLNYLR